MTIEQSNKRYLKFFGAILKTAVKDYNYKFKDSSKIITNQQRYYESKREKHSMEAKYFVEKSEQFKIYCDALGFAPARIRRLILEMK